MFCPPPGKPRHSSIHDKYHAPIFDDECTLSFSEIRQQEAIELRGMSLLPPERRGFENITGRVGIEGLRVGDSL